jgi:hypothetical protein
MWHGKWRWPWILGAAEDLLPGTSSICVALTQFPIQQKINFLSDVFSRHLTEHSVGRVTAVEMSPGRFSQNFSNFSAYRISWS